MLLAQASFAAGQPSMLLCTWERGHGNLDLEYLQRLKNRGFTVDFLDSRRDLTWERLRQYNAIVLYDFPSDDADKYRPAERGGAKDQGPRLTETIALVERYLDAGGGVFLLISEPIIYYGNANYYFAAQKALKRWGAQLPMEDVIVPPLYQRPHPRMLGKLWYYTENIQPSPVSEGVRRIFYPDPKMVNPSWFASGPIDVDDTWQVVVRGPKGSRTRTRQPESETEKAEWPKWKDALRYENPIEEPPLVAVRDIQADTKGRLALMWCWERCHIGQGPRWNWNGVMLDAGLDGLSSDFDRLFQNTMRWLAEPSLASETLGGAVIPSERLLPETKHPDYQERLERYPRTALPQQKELNKGSIFRGMIGPRTARSGGTGTVEEYAAKARELDLDFVIFLEDIRELTPAELDQLKGECRAHSDDTLMLYAGYRCLSNLGNQIFFTGRGVVYPPAHLLGGDDGKTYLVQGVDKDGKPISSNSSLAFHLAYGAGEQFTVGFFDFTGPMKTGGMSIPALRCFSMAGVRYYDHGKEVEDVTDQHLLTNEGSMSATPVSINLVDSPQAMAAELAAGHALTYAGAKDLNHLWEQALLWNHPFISPHVFPSDGPIIHTWPNSMRTKSYGQDDFVVAFNHLPRRLRVTSEVGLKEIALYDGSRLIARYLPKGAKEFDTIVHLNATFQQNISVVATDTRGGKAVSAPLRTWKAGIGSLYCADHVNEGRMRLFRGPAWQRMYEIPQAVRAGFTWDGGPPSLKPLFNLGYNRPDAVSDLGRQTAQLSQIPLHILCDERVSRSRSRALRASESPGNCWTSYGPLIDPPLFDGQSTYTQFTQYPADVDDGRGDLCEGRGNTSSLYEQELRFRNNQTITEIPLSAWWRKQVASHVTMLRGSEDKLTGAREVNPRQYRGSKEFVLNAGDWFAGVSRDPGNAMLFINQGEPISVGIAPERLTLHGHLPKTGLPVEKGDVYKTELLTLCWPVEQPLGDSYDLMPFVRYLKNPTGMDIIQGSRLEKPLGLVEFAVDKGVVEVSLPKPELPYEFNLPVRINGLNRNWSAILWQKQGQVGPYHGPGVDRIRPLGIDEEGRSYIPVTVGLTDNVHLVAGHPLVADNENVAVRVICLEDTAQGKQFRWLVTVHNPTDQEIATTLTPAMALPGLFQEKRELTIPAGEEIIIEKVGE
jgi:hypothetical protein